MLHPLPRGWDLKLKQQILKDFNVKELLGQDFINQHSL